MELSLSGIMWLNPRACAIQAEDGSQNAREPQ